MPKGAKSLQDDRKKQNQMRSDTKELRLSGDAKIARIRFLTDLEDFEWAYFHPVLASSRLGKKYTKEIYCMLQDGGDCQYCSNPETSAVRKKIFFWVYVYGVYHLKPDSESKWQKVEYLGENYYLETVNEARVLKTGPGKDGYIETRLLNWGKRFKTLCDRDYDWCREGTKMEDTVYDLVPVDEGKTDLSEEIKKVVENLQSISKIIDLTKPPTAGKSQGSDSSDENPPKDLEKEIEEIFS